jgi:hypothetical protein
VMAAGERVTHHATKVGAAGNAVRIGPKAGDAVNAVRIGPRAGAAGNAVRQDLGVGGLVDSGHAGAAARWRRMAEQ